MGSGGPRWAWHRRARPLQLLQSQLRRLLPQPDRQGQAQPSVQTWHTHGWVSSQALLLPLPLYTHQRLKGYETHTTRRHFEPQAAQPMWVGLGSNWASQLHSSLSLDWLGGAQAGCPHLLSLVVLQPQGSACKSFLYTFTALLLECSPLLSRMKDQAATLTPNEAGISSGASPCGPWRV